MKNLKNNIVVCMKYEEPKSHADFKKSQNLTHPNKLFKRCIKY